jgi:putative peptide zinc metalloprotease protein
MQQSIYSAFWYRIADLKPALRGHVEVHRHYYRGRPWFLIQDHSSGRFHRFTEDAYSIVSLLDGKHTLDQLWSLMIRKFGDGVMRQDEIVQLLAKLYRADVLLIDAPPDTEELFDRMEKTRNRMRFMRWRSPLSIRVPLLDPGRILDATSKYARLIFSPIGGIIWISMVVSALVLAGVHWSELTENVVDRVLGGENLLILLLTFPLVKALHEFGHAYATRVRGGEVHEMGIIFLVLMPVPYCEASSASAFSDRWSRALVGAAGMLVELFLAAIAMWIWVNAEPGLVRAVAYNVMIIAGISTLLFNGNPLIRFDGYYVLSDIIEIPNLATRSNQYFTWLVHRYLFGMVGQESPASTRGEARWLFFYSLGSFFYRIFLTITIVLFLAEKFFVVGIILAIWAFVLMALQPIWKQFMFLLNSPRLKGKRVRAWLVTIVFLGSIGWLGASPIPLATMVEGVVWVPEDARIRTKSSGFVSEVKVRNGERVLKDQVLLVSTSPELESRLLILRGQYEEINAQMESFRRTDQVQLELAREQLATVAAQVISMQAEIDSLVVRSHTYGKFIFQGRDELVGSFLPRGSMVGFVSNESEVIARIAVTQDRVDLVRNNTNEVQVKMVHNTADSYSAKVIREVPSASMSVPSMVLSTEGGGNITLDPRGAQEPIAFEALFQFDVRFPFDVDMLRYGERIYVRFDHGTEAAFLQLYRVIRQVFLKRFEV